MLEKKEVLLLLEKEELVGKGLVLQQLDHLHPLPLGVLGQHHLGENLAKVAVKNPNSALCEHLETTEGGRAGADANFRFVDS